MRRTQRFTTISALHLIALDRHAEAVSHAQRAIALKPDYTNAYLLLGDSFLKLRKLDEAIAAYRQGLVLDPAHAEAHNNLAEALFAQGHLNEAAQCFKEALRLKPDLVTAYNNLATIYFPGGRRPACSERHHARFAGRGDAASQDHVCHLPAPRNFDS